jgi:hypothetical protein
LNDLARFVLKQQEIVDGVKRGKLSNDDKRLLRKVKADLKQYFSLIAQIESLSNEKFDDSSIS